MASVSSLDKDLRQMRLDKYTPQAANEVRLWIEEVLGEKLPPGDLLDSLKDGVALCRLVNHAVSPGVKFKQSAMPFVQMENISHFLRACQMPPLNLPPHDVFLTVDLYESKDPAQVLQCIGAFSRRANAINPSVFPRSIGAKSKTGVISPQFSGSSQGSKPISGLEARARGLSNVSDNSPTMWNPLAKASYSGRISPTKNDGPISPGEVVSSWSKKDDEGKTAPAWNIHQYGYMGGASQGNQGIAFGARRQITSAAPSVPSLAEKERRRKEEQAEAERRRQQAEEAERRRKEEFEAEERRARQAEERRWEEETKRQREIEKREAEEEQRRWDAEQRRRKEEENARLREERNQESQMAAQRSKQRTVSDARLNGQFLNQYQADQKRQAPINPDSRSTSESERIADLERQLAEAKEREQQHERERLEKANGRSRPTGQVPAPALSQPAPYPVPKASVEDDWQDSERDYLRKEWNAHQPQPPSHFDRPTPQPPRPPLAEPADQPLRHNPLHPSSRPLPEPSTPTQYQPNISRTDRYLASNPPPPPPKPTSYRPPDYSTTTEVDLENQRRAASQAKTKAGGWASKSLLEREMERERERQREWEEGQKASASIPRDTTEGAGPGQSWDVHQYGYMGGDSQNRGGPGLGVGGPRRQIIGPRPPP